MSQKWLHFHRWHLDAIDGFWSRMDLKLNTLIALALIQIALVAWIIFGG